MSRRSVNEIMGKKGEHAKANGIEFNDLPELLGDNMPKLEFHTLGRVRLVRALRNRFGANFRSVPGVSELMTKFDHEAKINLDHHIAKKRLSRLGKDD